MDRKSEGTGSVNQEEKEKPIQETDEPVVVVVDASKLQDLAVDGHAVAFDRHGKALIKTDKLAEQRLRLKIDLHVIPVVFMLYIFCFIDRSSIGNARLSTFEKDLGMKGFDYNIAISVFFAVYAFVEIPSNIICKIVGPSRWIPTLTIGFGLVTLITAFIHSFHDLLIIRAFLGFFEGGMLPGIAFYLSRWYRKDELVFRMGIFFIATPLSGCFGGLLSSGLLLGTPIGTVVRWRKIFLVEGIISMSLGFLGYFFMTHSIERASWLTKEEKALAAVRIKSEYVATTELNEKIRLSTIKSGIFNINTFLIGLLFLINNMIVQGLVVFLPTIIASLFPKASLIGKQLKTVPPYVVGTVLDLAIPYWSFKMNNRAIPGATAAVMLVIGYAIFLGSHNPHARYGGTFFVACGAFSFGTICNSWVAINSSPDAARATAIGTTVMLGQLGGLISAWTYLPTAAPEYVPGNSLGAALGVCHIILCGVIFAYQYRENKLREQGKRDYRLEGLSIEEQALLGHHHPDFRYSY